MNRFEGQTVWVTGGASGMGASHSARFAAEGAAVGCIDVDGAQLAEVVKGISDRGGKAHAVIADLTDLEQVKTAGAELMSALGAVQIVVANVGGGQRPAASVEELPVAEWRRVLALNLDTAFFTAQVAIPQLKHHSNASVIFISSTAGLCGMPGISAYAAAKHGVIGLMRTLANELADEGVRVNAICPGTVDTPALDSEAAMFGLTRGELIQHEVRTFLLQRVIKANDISDAVLWLASEEAAMVTGVALPVDGGYMERRILVDTHNENAT